MLTNAPNFVISVTLRYPILPTVNKGFFNVAIILSDESLYINASTLSPTVIFLLFNDFLGNKTELPSSSIR